MRFPLLLTLQALWLTVCQATQHYPTTWGHYDLCKSHGYTDEGPTWYYMACQPEAADMTKYLKVTLDPPNITCGDPPETYCTLAGHGLLSLSLSEAVGLIRPVTAIAGRQQTRCGLERTKHWRDRCFTLQSEVQEAGQIHL
ncbi:hypothetical protein PO909_017290 [Leuciscus waleckii]